MAEAARHYQTGLTYTARLTPGEDGWICAQMAEVPEAISQGRTEAEARANVTPRRSSYSAMRASRFPSAAR